jgi:superfamily II DNA or RNA helicase
MRFTAAPAYLRRSSPADFLSASIQHNLILPEMEVWMPAVATPNRSSKKPSKARSSRTPRTRKPDDLSLEEWQVALRREFGREQKFKLQNTTDEPVFSDFLVTNPQTQRTYRVGIRGGRIGDNHCTCPDFAVNTLGTCKHIEFVLGRLERRRATRQLLQAGYEPPFSEIYLRYGAQRHVALRVGSSCPHELRRQLQRDFNAHSLLRPEAYARFDKLLHELNASGHEVRCDEQAIHFIAQVRDREQLRRRIDRAFPEGIDTPAFQRLLRVQLYPYQRAGALFLAGSGRALLADDMGLGKTIQTIAAAEILARCGGVERVLVVTPTSLKHQWQQEIERFSGRSCQVVEGMIPARAAAYRGDGSFYKITNYEVLHHDLPAIEQWGPDLIVLDEAQRIKNWKTRTAQTVKQLPSQHAMVLTGTPLENRLEELHSIVEFVDRFRLGPAFRFLHQHQQLDEDGRVVGYRNLDSIARTLEPILLRRTKSQVLNELPPRLEKHLYIPMTPQQMEHHQENQEIVARIVAKWRRHHFLSEADQRRMTAALQNMRMSCNSTYLLDPTTEHGEKPDELVNQLEEILEERDAKAVVFSQWLGSHELLLRRLQKRRIGHVLFHGGVPGPKRKDLVSRFKQESGCRVFLSTDAGGVGLNLQNASAVLNMDQPWNPAVLEQRIGRVHRLGQARPVQVVHFVSQNSIEQGMLEVLRFKKSLFAGVLDGGQSEVFLGGTRLKRFMESVEAASGAVRKEALPSEHDEQAIRPARTAAQRFAGAAEERRSGTEGAGAVDADALRQLVSAGRTVLDSLAQALEQPVSAVPGNGDANGASPASPFIERDPQTGREYLKLPLPDSQLLGKAALWLQVLAGALKK